MAEVSPSLVASCTIDSITSSESQDGWWARGGRAMAVLLDGNRLRSLTRTERLLQIITLDAVLKCAPVASIAGVPLAIIFARDFTIGYASRLGIPSEFVKADPATAVAPFAIITMLLLIGLLLLHEIDQIGVAEAVKSWGRGARLFLFVAAGGIFAGWALRRGEDVGILVASVVALYGLLWLLPAIISWILRQIIRIIGILGWLLELALWTVSKRRRGVIARRMNSSRTYPLQSSHGNKVLFAMLVVVGVMTLPRPLGVWAAMTTTDFAVVDRGKDHTEAILEVYGDKAFIGWVEDNAVLRVEMVAVSDLEGKPIWIEEVGPLRFIEGE
jgi:hypothetical protein